MSAQRLWRTGLSEMSAFERNHRLRHRSERTTGAVPTPTSEVAGDAIGTGSQKGSPIVTSVSAADALVEIRAAGEI